MPWGRRPVPVLGMPELCSRTQEAFTKPVDGPVENSVHQWCFECGIRHLNTVPRIQAYLPEVCICAILFSALRTTEDWHLPGQSVHKDCGGLLLSYVMIRSLGRRFPPPGVSPAARIVNAIRGYLRAPSLGDGVDTAPGTTSESDALRR